MTNEVTQKTTSNEQNVSSSNGLEPLLRFPEYTDSWKEKKLGDIVSENLHPVPMPCSDYVRVGLYCHAKGTFHELVPIDKALDVDTMYVVPKNNLIVNITFAWEHAIAITTADDEGKLVSHRFPTYSFNENEYHGFYKYAILKNRFRYELGVASPGGAGRNRVLNKKAFLEIPMLTPSLSEQQKIADFLSLVDARIEKQRLLVESLKKYKRGVIFKLFSKNNPNNQSFSLRELLHEKNDRNSLGLRVCSVAVNKGIIDQIEHLGRCFAASDTSKYRRVSYGDVVYTKSPTGDFPYGIVKQSKIHSDVCVSPLYGVYKTLNYEVGNLIHAYFELHQLANNYIRPLAQKGAKNTINITTSHFLDDIIYFPSNDKNRKNISNFLDKLTRCISIHEEKLRQNEKLKKGLLQKMFI